MTTQRTPISSRLLSPLELLRTIWRQRVILFASIFFCMGIAEIFLARTEREYSSRLVITYILPQSEGLALGRDGLKASPERTLATQIEIIRSPTLYDRVVKRMTSPHTKLGIRGDVRKDTDVLSLMVVSDSPNAAHEGSKLLYQEFIKYLYERKATTVNLLTSALADEIEQIEKSLLLLPESNPSGLEQARRSALLVQLEALERRRSDIEISISAGIPDVAVLYASDEPPKISDYPRPKRTRAAGILFGASLGSLAALILGLLRRRVINSNDISLIDSTIKHLKTVDLTQQMRGPAPSGSANGRRQLPKMDLTSTLSDLGILRSRSLLIGVSSVDSQNEIAPAVSALLALRASELGCRVVLVDATHDEGPRIATTTKSLELSRTQYGFFDGAAADAQLDEIVQSTGLHNLCVVNRGTERGDPLSSVMRSGIGRILHSFKSQFDLTILNLSPVQQSLVSQNLLRYCDIHLGIAIIGVTPMSLAWSSNSCVRDFGEQNLERRFLLINDRRLATQRWIVNRPRRHRSCIEVLSEHVR